VDDRDEAVRTAEDVVREVVGALAPRELPYLAGVVVAYRVQPWFLARAPGGSWSPFVLAFVAEAVLPLLTPDPTRRGRLAAVLARRHRSRDLVHAPGTPVPAFDGDQLRRAWAAAVDAAGEHGCPAGDREAFAAALVGTLAAGHRPRTRWSPARA
jgi:hypothetical protein